MSRNKIEILIIILLTISVIVVFIVYKDGKLKFHSADQAEFEKVVQPSKINKFFNVKDKKTIEEYTSPGPNGN